MLSRGALLVLPIVCAAHLALMFSFSHQTGSYGVQNTKKLEADIQLVTLSYFRATVQDKTSDQNVTQPLVPGLRLPKNPPISDSGAFLNQPQDNIPALLALYRERFLDLDSLDQAATGSSQFESLLDDILPRRFAVMTLEILIDRHGRAVYVNCIDGECSEALFTKLQQLLVVPFTPAVKDGQSVASRKVIRVEPAVTNEL